MGLQNRGKLVHFIADKDETIYNRLAKGFAELSSSKNPTTQEKTYIDDTTDTVTTAYNTSWAVSGDIYTGDPSNMMLFDLATLEAKGDDAVVYLISAFMWEPHSKEPDRVFKGFKQMCAFVPDNDGGGTGGESVSFSGTLSAKGDRQHGWVTITKPANNAPWTCTFNEEEPV
jgi:hypothetical protein